MSDIIRYDGTRFITEEEIDEQFTGKLVLIAVSNGLDRDGYLIASADGNKRGVRSILSDIAIDELDSQATVVYGCKTRGMNLHVELLD